MGMEAPSSSPPKWASNPCIMGIDEAGRGPVFRTNGLWMLVLCTLLPEQMLDVELCKKVSSFVEEWLLLWVWVGSATSPWAQFVVSAMRRNARNFDKKRFRVSCVSSAVNDQYKSLKISPGASESEVKKAFRQLALQYHPDVCRGSNCGVQFHQINEAYDVVMSHVRGESRVHKLDMYEHSESADDDEMRGMNDPDWDLWEEWMGWEGAGIRDYSDINPHTFEHIGFFLRVSSQNLRDFVDVL